MYSLPFDLFMGDGLSFASRGALNLFIDTLSDAMCIARRIHHAVTGGYLWLPMMMIDDIYPSNFSCTKYMCIFLILNICGLIYWLGVVQWTLVAMNIDCVVAITWPFWARTHATQRVTIFVLMVIVLCMFANSFLTVVYYGVVSTTNNLIGKLCTGFYKGNIIFLFNYRKSNFEA